MELMTKKMDDVLIIYLKGRFDILSSPDIESRINSYLDNESSRHLLFNLKDLHYISSSGLRIFYETRKKLKKTDRKLMICNMNNPVRDVFNVVNLLDKFEVYDSEDEITSI